MTARVFTQGNPVSKTKQNKQTKKTPLFEEGVFQIQITFGTWIMSFCKDFVHIKDVAHTFNPSTRETEAGGSL